MPTYARGINGSVAGVVALSGTTSFTLKTERWSMRIRQDVHDVSGYGDGGDTYWSAGKNVVRGSFGGFVLTGTGNEMGVYRLTGTHDVYILGTFTADNGVTLSGSVRVTQTDIDSNYKRGGFTPVVFNFVGEGPMTEA